MTTLNPNPPLEEVMNINHEGSLEDLFKEFIKEGRKGLLKNGNLIPAAFLIFRNHVDDKFNIAIYPMVKNDENSMLWHGRTLKGIISNIRKIQDTSKIEIIGVIIGMEAYLSTRLEAEILDSNGNIDPSKYVKPSEDKNAKDALVFQLEDDQFKHTIYYEYIKSDEGNIVISNTPYLDNITPYNKQEDENSNLGFVFVKPTE